MQDKRYSQHFSKRISFRLDDNQFCKCVFTQTCEFLNS